MINRLRGLIIEKMEIFNPEKEITNGTNEKLTFYDIYCIEMEGKRVIAFQIPPAIQV